MITRSVGMWLYNLVHLCSNKFICLRASFQHPLHGVEVLGKKFKERPSQSYQNQNWTVISSVSSVSSLLTKTALRESW